MSEEPQPDKDKLSEAPTEEENPQDEGTEESDLGYVEVDESEPTEEQKPPRIKELLASPDSPSRFMMYLSIGFGAMSLLCVILLVYVIITHRQAKKPVALDHDEQSMYVEPAAQQSLGHYQVVLKAEANQPHDFNLRVDIVAQCSSKDACDTLKAKQVEARDVINPILSSVTRDEFLTLQGKNRMRRRIAEQLSGMVTEGKVEEVHFTDLTIETGR